MAITQTVSTADRTSLAFIEQTAFNTIPPSNPTIAGLRYSSHSLAQRQDLIKSPEIRGDRQSLPGKRVSVNTAGDIMAPVSFESHEAFQLAAIGATAFSSAESANTGSFTATATQFTGTGIATNLAVGDMMQIGGMAAANNTVYKIVARPDANTLTTDPPPATAEGPIASATCQPLQKASNGTAMRVFTIEEEELDLSGVFTQYVDQYVNALSMTADVGSLAEQTFSMMGSYMDPDSGATIGDGSNTETSETDVMGPVDEVMTIIHGVRGSSARIDARRVEIRLEAGGRTRQNLGDLYPSSVGHGTFKVSGTLTVLKEDAALIARYANFTDNLNLIYVLKDTAGNILAWDVPFIQFGDGQVPVSGQDSDRLVEIQFEGSIESNEGVMFNFHKFAAS